MVLPIYIYNDIKGFDRKLNNVKSNLCTFYFKDKSQFCGNYCSRKGVHGNLFSRRCWRHKQPVRNNSVVVLLMISASGRTYNRDRWIQFLSECQTNNIPIVFLIYHQNMQNTTLRDPQNLISRFRPFPDLFTQILPLQNRHGGIHFTQTYLNMLQYGCKIPHSAVCIVLTERTIPIRSAREIYRRAVLSKCYINISYNIHFDKIPDGLLTKTRTKKFAGVNNCCQGLLTTKLLRLALPSVENQCEKFGISLVNKVYTITNNKLFEQWRKYTGSNPSEFLLLNSYLLENIGEKYPMDLLRKHMEKTVENDVYTVAEIPEWRDGYKRTFVFRHLNKRFVVPVFDYRIKRYYSPLNLKNGVTLQEIINFLVNRKEKALFFRQIEMP